MSASFVNVYFSELAQSQKHKFYNYDLPISNSIIVFLPSEVIVSLLFQVCYLLLLLFNSNLYFIMIHVSFREYSTDTIFHHYSQIFVILGLFRLEFFPSICYGCKTHDIVRCTIVMLFCSQPYAYWSSYIYSNNTLNLNNVLYM